MILDFTCPRFLPNVPPDALRHQPGIRLASVAHPSGIQLAPAGHAPSIRTAAPMMGPHTLLVEESCRSQAANDTFRAAYPSTPPRPHPRRASTYSPHHHGCGFRGQPSSLQVVHGTLAVDGSLRSGSRSWVGCARWARSPRFLSFLCAHRLLRVCLSFHSVHRVIHNWGELRSDQHCSSDRQERPGVEGSGPWSLRSQLRGSPLRRSQRRGSQRSRSH